MKKLPRASTETVALGFEVGPGTPVNIPVRHMVVCGQTQEAGKTTALEALITRSGLRAVTFVTKRGEGSFTNARRVAPYFRDNAGDWQYVAAILEASRGEKLKMERSFIIRASKGATSLAGVHTNVKRLMADPKVRGLAADMYLCLDAYLDVVVPTIAKTDWAEALILEPGVNAVDLTDVPAEMQHLVIQSSIDWVLQHEAETVVVIPEAWKFVPEGRKTPVKQSAVALIRQGAALRNYVWLDSQDIGGISKEILRSCPVWLLGVQREANEIKRTLENVPDGLPKLKRVDISTLELGQFYACHGRHAIKTYVQPAWMDPTIAACVARGEWSAAEAARTSQQLQNAGTVRRLFENAVKPPREQEVNVNEANALRKENDELRARNRELHERLVALEANARGRTAGSAARQNDARDANDVDAPRRDGVRPAATAAPSVPARTFSPQESFDNEALYQAIKARLIEELPSDPRVMQIVVSRPELQVKVTRQTIEADGDSVTGLIGRLIANGYFDGGVSSAATLKELQRMGRSLSPGTLYPAMDKIAAMGFLTIEDGKDDRGRARKEYKAVAGMKVNIVEA